MPFNGSGTFVPLSPPDFPALPFTTILASQFNNNLNDLFTSGLTNCMTRDGQSPPTANIPMAGFKLTGLGAGTNPTDGVQLQQTLATIGQVGVVDWNTRITNGIFEGTAASLTTPATNFPPTSQLGELVVIAQGALVTQLYSTQNNTYKRQKVGGVWSIWSAQKVVESNGVINGAFQVWQAGVSLGSGTGTRYIADMWPNSSTGTTYTSSQQPFPIGQTDVPPLANFFYRTTFSSVAGANNFCFLNTLVEDVRSFSGQTVTISFYAKASTSLPIALEFGQYFGAGGSPSATVSTFVAKPTLSTSWARYSATISIPSILGKILGADGKDGLLLNIWFDAGSNFAARTGTLGQQSGTVDIFGVKVEADSAATDYVIPNEALERSICYRYYVQVGLLGSNRPVVFSGNVTSTGGYFIQVQFPETMWISPSVTLNNLSVSLFPASASITSDSQGAFITLVANGTGGGAFVANYIADARF